MSHIEQAKYTLVQTDKNIELRDYDPALVAEVKVRGERKKALREGFRIIADYIFGNNLNNKKVAMTAPVLQEQSASIAMSALMTQDDDDTLWLVRFVMPSNYTLESLPRPKNFLVNLIGLDAKRFATIRFSGVPRSNDLKKNLEEILAWLSSHNLKAIGKPIYAFYNPPWTLPFLRRNEVMIEIEK